MKKYYIESRRREIPMYNKKDGRLKGFVTSCVGTAL